MKKLIKKWHSGRDFHDDDAEITSYRGVLSYRRLAAALCYKSEVTGRRHIVATPEGAARVGLDRKIITVSYAHLTGLINYHLSGTKPDINRWLLNFGSPPAYLTGKLLCQHAGLPEHFANRADYLFKLKLIKKRFIIITPTKIDREMRVSLVLNQASQINWFDSKILHWYTCDDPEEVALITLMSMDTTVIDTRKVKEAWS